VGTHSNIKADKAAIIVGSIYHPHLCNRVFKWPGRPITEEVKGDFDCVANLVAWKFPAGEAGNISGLRIQTAAK
jgi:hypothetical protein